MKLPHLARSYVRDENLAVKLFWGKVVSTFSYYGSKKIIFNLLICSAMTSVNTHSLNSFYFLSPRKVFICIKPYKPQFHNDFNQGHKIRNFRHSLHSCASSIFLSHRAERTQVKQQFHNCLDFLVNSYEGGSEKMPP